MEEENKEKEQTEKTECSNDKLLIATTIINVITIIILLVKLFN